MHPSCTIAGGAAYVVGGLVRSVWNPGTVSDYHRQLSDGRNRGVQGLCWREIGRLTVRQYGESGIASEGQ